MVWRVVARAAAAAAAAADGRLFLCVSQSVGAQFKNQLNNLLGAIGETHPHYVRCLKPNDENVRSNFNIGRITSQLANGGEPGPGLWFTTSVAASDVACSGLGWSDAGSTSSSRS